VTGSVLDFAREYDLPPEIVWDALVDSDLVSGWLASATIDGLVGGRYDLRWLSHPDDGGVSGVIEALEPPRRLTISTQNSGLIDFELRPVEGGTRGVSTELVLHVVTDTEPRFSRTTRAYWLSNLDQLAELLRGHPVDWDNWERDRGPAWEGYRREGTQDDSARP
jgi:uncharacterized protein YndB with AHSA1/START domain